MTEFRKLLLVLWILFELKYTHKTTHCIYNLGNIYQNNDDCLLYGYNYDIKYGYFIVGNKLNNINCSATKQCLISNNINDNSIYMVYDNKLYPYSLDISKEIIETKYVYKNEIFYVFNGNFTSNMDVIEINDNNNKEFDIIKNTFIGAFKNSYVDGCLYCGTYIFVNIFEDIYI